MRFPVGGARGGFGFAEIARRHGDFALAGVAVHVRRDGGGDARRVRGLRPPGGARRDGPARAPTPTEAGLRPSADALADEIVDTGGDTHGSRGYRARLLRRARRAASCVRASTGRPARMRVERRRAARPTATVDVTVTVNGRAVTLAVRAAHARSPTPCATGSASPARTSGASTGCAGCARCCVDGEAVRACLLFAVQCDGADDRPPSRAWARPTTSTPCSRRSRHHHALQCGFCTPGMLMSSYDLLAPAAPTRPRRPARGHVRRALPVHRLPRASSPRSPTSRRPTPTASRHPAPPCRRRSSGAPGTSAAWRRRHPVCRHATQTTERDRGPHRHAHGHRRGPQRRSRPRWTTCGPCSPTSTASPPACPARS